MKNLLLSLLLLCTGTLVYAGHIEWHAITVNHFWTIFDTIKVGDTVPAELIGAKKGNYQFKKSYFTGIQDYDYFFFIPHPGPGHPIRVTTRNSMYGRRVVSEELGNDSKELTEYMAGSLYDTLKLNSFITIQGMQYHVIDYYPKNDTTIIFTLLGNDNKQKELLLEQRENVGNVFIACNDREELQQPVPQNLDDKAEEFTGCCKMVTSYAIALLKQIIFKKQPDKIA